MRERHLRRRPDHRQPHLRQHGTGHRPWRRRGHLQRLLSAPGTEQPPELPDHRHHRRRPARGLAGRQHARHDLPHRCLRQRRLRPRRRGRGRGLPRVAGGDDRQPGQAVFDVPFTPPAGLPIVTATATDPQGNTSEVSAAAPGHPGGADAVRSRGSRSAADLSRPRRAMASPCTTRMPGRSTRRGT